MSISVQFLPQKISAHFKFQLNKIVGDNSDNLRPLFVTSEMIPKKLIR